MSEQARIAIRMAGEAVYIVEKNGLRVELSLVCPEKNLGVSRRIVKPWQASDFHGGLEFEMSQAFQGMGRDLAHKLAPLAPNGYYQPPKPPIEATRFPERPAPLENPVIPAMTDAPKRRGRPPNATRAPAGAHEAQP